VSRAPNAHLAFGHGVHFCLGAALARVEMEALLTSLLQRFTRISLAEEDIEWQPTLDFRGPARLLVRYRTG
jgi:pimeloyl-[acyl-carrier protein] synthase